MNEGYLDDCGSLRRGIKESLKISLRYTLIAKWNLARSPALGEGFDKTFPEFLTHLGEAHRSGWFDVSTRADAPALR
jgi:hypothetical protein